MPAAERHSWRMPSLALLKPAAWPPGTKLGILMLRGYLLTKVLLLIVKAVQLRGTEPAARKPPHVAATSRRPRAGGIINMATLTVAARLFRNRAHAEIRHQPAGPCRMRSARRRAARIRPSPSPCSPPGPPPQARGPMPEAVMQSFAGLNIPSSSAGPSRWARASPRRHRLRPGPGHSCTARCFVLRDPLRPDPPPSCSPAHPGRDGNPRQLAPDFSRGHDFGRCNHAPQRLPDLQAALRRTGPYRLHGRPSSHLPSADSREPSSCKEHRRRVNRLPAGAAQPRRTGGSGRNLALVARVNGPHKIGISEVGRSSPRCVIGPRMAQRAHCRRYGRC